MSQDAGKRAAAEAALKYLVPGEPLGVGTGSTVNFFIDALAARKADVPGAVSSSEASSKRLQAIGIPVLNLNDTGTLSLYVDGADESDAHLRANRGSFVLAGDTLSGAWLTSGGNIDVGVDFQRETL